MTDFEKLVISHLFTIEDRLTKIEHGQFEQLKVAEVIDVTDKLAMRVLRIENIIRTPAGVVIMVIQ